MKKRILSFVLAAVTILSMFTVCSSAAWTILDNVGNNTSSGNTLQSKIDAVGNGGTYTLNESTTLTTTTIIPAGRTLVIPASVSLAVVGNAELIVRGTLEVYGRLTAGKYNLTIDGGRYIDANQQGYAYYYPGINQQYYFGYRYGGYPYNGLYPYNGTYPYFGYTGNGYYGYYGYYGAGAAGYCAIHPTSYITYCNVCNSYHCALCQHNDISVPSSDEWCSVHKIAKSFCNMCNTYYCPLCSEHNHFVSNIGHIHTVPGYCSVCGRYVYPNNYVSDYYNFYNYYNYGNTSSCETPVADVKSGSKVRIGDTITLTSNTPGALIYYTTNGSQPHVGSTLYRGPIRINGSVTIRAIAVRSGYSNSASATFKYIATSNISFSDIAKYDGLDDIVSTLVTAGVIEDAKKYEPMAAVTYGELCNYLSALGIDVNKSDFSVFNYKDSDILTYNDFVYITYKTLRAYDIIKSPRSDGSIAIKSIPLYKNIAEAAVYKAAFVAFLENHLFYDLSFDPAQPAARIYLASAVSSIIDILSK